MRLPHFIPKRNELQLVDFIFAASQEAAEALWVSIENYLVVKNLSLGGYRLLPLVHWRLENSKIESPLFPELQHIALKSWETNETIFNKFIHIKDRFQKDGIAFIPLKGYPLALNYYPNRSTRPMGDIDVWVQPENVGRATTALEDLGYVKNNPLYKVAPIHAMEFVKVSAFETIDLHWQIIHGGSMEVLNAAIWEVAAKSAEPGCTELSLLASDLLFNILVHAAFISQISPVRWVADAHFIISRESAAIDWDRIVWLSNLSRRSPMVAVQLQFLRDHFLANIPLETINSLSSLQISRAERFNYSLIALTPRSKYFYKLKAHYRNVLFGIEDMPSKNLLDICGYILRYVAEKIWLRLTGQYAD